MDSRPTITVQWLRVNDRFLIAFNRDGVTRTWQLTREETIELYDAIAREIWARDAALNPPLRTHEDRAPKDIDRIVNQGNAE